MVYFWLGQGETEKNSGHGHSGKGRLVQAIDDSIRMDIGKLIVQCIQLIIGGRDLVSRP
jgi:hypothetical protein